MMGENRMDRIIVLVGSPRRNGNTALLAESFAKGARKSNIVELLHVADYRIHPEYLGWVALERVLNQKSY